jgi:methyl-accepting chemotaxis protein
MRNTPAIKSTNLNGRQLLAALRAFRKGNFSVRLPIDLTGLDGEIADAFNEVVELNERMSKEIERLSHIVGKQGKIGTGPSCRTRLGRGPPTSTWSMTSLATWPSRPGKWRA